MKTTYIDESPDLDRLFMVHLPALMGTDEQRRAVVAILYGNEDAPTRVDLFDADDAPGPFTSFVQNECGNLAPAPR